MRVLGTRTEASPSSGGAWQIPPMHPFRKASRLFLESRNFRGVFLDCDLSSRTIPLAEWARGQRLSLERHHSLGWCFLGTANPGRKDCCSHELPILRPNYL